MRILTGHIVEGDPAPQLIITVMDETSHGGANHKYRITNAIGSLMPLRIEFQKGPIKEYGINGITGEALLAIEIDRLEPHSTWRGRDEPDMSARWRIGKRVSLNVYQGDRPVCQCHTVLDAMRIVKAMNDSEAQSSHRTMSAAPAMFALLLDKPGDDRSARYHIAAANIYVADDPWIPEKLYVEASRAQEVERILNTLGMKFEWIAEEEHR